MLGFSASRAPGPNCKKDGSGMNGGCLAMTTHSCA
uniref:Uncharacterized protein n=1 Tax=Anguilla anguilla TaxID=7936 RepID=A0A0E9VDT9_ANGAN